MSRELFITKDDVGILNKKQVRDFFNQLPTGKWLLKAERKDKRTTSQNSYLHAAMLPVIRDALREAGWNDIKTIYDAKRFLKGEFLRYDIVNEKTGEVKEGIRDTSDLTKLQFMQLVTDVQIWLLDYFNIELPLPGEQVKMFNDEQ